MYRLRFSKLYRNDVNSSYNYIKNKLEAPTAAENLIKAILEKLNKIKGNPNIRPLVQDKYLASRAKAFTFQIRQIKGIEG